MPIHGPTLVIPWDPQVFTLTHTLNRVSSLSLFSFSLLLY